MDGVSNVPPIAPPSAAAGRAEPSPASLPSSLLLPFDVVLTAVLPTIGEGARTGDPQLRGGPDEPGEGEKHAPTLPLAGAVALPQVVSGRLERAALPPSGPGVSDGVFADQPGLPAASPLGGVPMGRRSVEGAPLAGDWLEALLRARTPWMGEAASRGRAEPPSAAEGAMASMGSLMPSPATATPPSPNAATSATQPTPATATPTSTEPAAQVPAADAGSSAPARPHRPLAERDAILRVPSSDGGVETAGVGEGWEPPPEGEGADGVSLGRVVRDVGSAPGRERSGDGTPAGPAPARASPVPADSRGLPPWERPAWRLPASPTAFARADERAAFHRLSGDTTAGDGVDAEPPAPAGLPHLPRARAELPIETPAPDQPSAASTPPPLQAVADAVVELDGVAGEARIHLDPPELGDVLVHVHRTSEGLHVEVRVERPETALLFAAHRSAFEAQLAARGLALGSLAIDLAGGGLGREGRAGDAEAPTRTDRSFAALLEDEPSGPSVLQRRARTAYNPDGSLVLWA